MVVTISFIVQEMCKIIMLKTVPFSKCGGRLCFYRVFQVLISSETAFKQWSWESTGSAQLSAIFASGTKSREHFKLSDH